MKISTSIDSNDVQSDILMYEPPQIEVVEISVEKGFANSSRDWEHNNW